MYITRAHMVYSGSISYKIGLDIHRGVSSEACDGKFCMNGGNSKKEARVVIVESWSSFGVGASHVRHGKVKGMEIIPQKFTLVFFLLQLPPQPGIVVSLSCFPTYVWSITWL